MSIAHIIDHTALKATTTANEIKKLCEEAVKYGFATVCVPPYFVSKATETLKNSQVGITTVIGFPFGYSHYSAKLMECEKAVSDGATELDMVINIAALKNNDLDYLAVEGKGITDFASKEGRTLKLIIESGILSNEEIIECCALYKNFPVNFLKTSTGYADKGATIEAVRLMRQNLPPHIKIKASGGIKTFSFAKELVNAGAERLGCSASVAIVTDTTPTSNGY